MSATIKAVNISKVFNAGSRNSTRVLDHVSFELPERGLYIIFGKSGSGKTTLLNILGGLDRPSGGEVYLNGKLLSKDPDGIRNSHTGFIFQNYYLERGCTVMQVMRNAMKIAGERDEKLIEEKSVAALQMVGMEKFANKASDALSGGQQQRVAIARALAKGGDVIFADEPTGNLDAENTKKVMDILKTISKSRLVVVVTHELSLIKKYADGCIKLVDGKITEISGDAVISDLEGKAAQSFATDTHAAEALLGKTDTDRGRRTGRLFSATGVLKAEKRGEKGFARLVKLIFLCAAAIVTSLFALGIFNVFSAKADVTPVDGNSVYVKATDDIYADLRRLDESLYRTVEFFEVHKRTGGVSYPDIVPLSGVEVSYTPVSLTEEHEELLTFGSMPQQGEVLVTDALAKKLKEELGVAELKSDETVTHLIFNEEWKVSGIMQGEEMEIAFNRYDYVNFLGVYGEVGITDRNELFIDGEYAENTFSAQIYTGDTGVDLQEGEAVLEINRNSLYKMTSDVSQADYRADAANSRISESGASDAFAFADSRLYIRRLIISRDMEVDMRIYVTQETLDDIFVYLAPDPDAVTLDATETGNEFFFRIVTDGEEQKEALQARLSDRGIAEADVTAIGEREEEQLKEEAASSLAVYGVVIALIMLIYYFTEKAESIQNSRDYGVYRAIGVNKGNLLYRETIKSFFGNILPYLIFSVLAGVVISVMLALSSAGAGIYAGIAAGIALVGAAVMTGISVLPYLFVLRQTPAQILAKYDI